MEITTYDVAKRFIGIHEVPGPAANPLIAAMLQLCHGETSDEIPWCSAFVNFVHHVLGLPCTYRLNARSWLAVGSAIAIEQAVRGDVVIFDRPPNPASGHVAFFDQLLFDLRVVSVIGGNQKNAVNVARFDLPRVIGVRRFSLSHP